MFAQIVITENELAGLKSRGTVYICRSCKDNKNKLVLVDHKIGGIQHVFTDFCADCVREMEECETCPSKRK